MSLFTTQHKIASKRIFDGVILNLRMDTLKDGDKTVTREIVEHNGGVVILAQPSESEVILIKQYRYTLDQYILEFPAGRIEKDEDPSPAAYRELIEETGYKAETWQDLGTLLSAPGFCTEKLYMYGATDLTFVGKNLDEDEETEVIIVSVKEARALLMKEDIKDAKTLAGLFLLQDCYT